VTIAERLRDAGYQTGAVIRNPWITVERGFKQGFTYFHEAWREEEGAILNENERVAMDTAIQWIEKHAGEPKPFFLFVNLNVAHLPFTPPEEVARRFLSLNWSLQEIRRLQGIRSGWLHITGKMALGEEDFNLLRELYEAEIAFADELVGLMLDTLKRQGIFDNTLIMLTSDHGENIGDHDLMDHQYNLFDTTVRVPLIIRFPKRFGRGGVEDDLVSLVDIYPTLLDATNLLVQEENQQIMSMSLCNPDRAPRQVLFAEDSRPVNAINYLKEWFPHYDTSQMNQPIYMIRTPEHKLIWKKNKQVNLYDLKKDPFESNDLSESQTELSDRLLKHLKDWIAVLKKLKVNQPFKSRDAESLERLRSLGYIK
jgi:arylsulfatase A-like enzyme